MKELLITRKLFDRSMEFLERSLNVRSARQNVITSNIANSETPGYEAKDIPFQKVLNQFMGESSSVSMQKTHPQHFPAPGSPSPAIEPETVSQGVQIDLEMSKLAENNLMYQSTIQALVKKLETLKYIISEGGR